MNDRSLCYWVVGINTSCPAWMADLFDGDEPVKWCGDGTNYEGTCTGLADAETQVKALAKTLGVTEIVFDNDSTEFYRRD